MDNTFHAQVLGINKAGTHYKIRAVNSGLMTEGQKTEWAAPLSPIPTSGGGGMKATPADFSNLFAICFRVSMQQVYVLGFCPIPEPMKSAPVLGGGTSLVGQTGAGLRVGADGIISLFSDQWAQWVLEPAAQNGFGQFRHMTLKWWTGWVRYAGIEDTGRLSLYVAKKLDKSAIPTSLESPPDNIKVELGTLDTDAIVEWTVQCDANTAKIFDFKMFGYLANLSEKKAIHYEQKSTLAGSSGTFNVDTDGNVEYTVKDNTKTFKVTFTGAGSEKAGFKLNIGEGNDILEVSLVPGSTDAVMLTVNKDKATVIIDKEGNTIFKLSDAAKMYLGGKDKSQQLVTKSWVDLVFANHMHPSAAPGPPSIPIPIPAPPVAADSPTNLFTFSTQAE